MGCSHMTANRITIASLIAGVVFATATASPAVQVAYFPLDENNSPSLGTPVADLSANPHNGTVASDALNNPPAGATEGIPSANSALFGTAYSFFYPPGDRGNYVDVNYSTG